MVFTCLTAARFRAIPKPLKTRYDRRSIQPEASIAAECVDYTAILSVVSYSTSIKKCVLYWNASCKQCIRQYFTLNFSCVNSGLRHGQHHCNVHSRKKDFMCNRLDRETRDLKQRRRRRQRKRGLKITFLFFEQIRDNFYLFSLCNVAELSMS